MLCTMQEDGCKLHTHLIQNGGNGRLSSKTWAFGESGLLRKIAKLSIVTKDTEQHQVLQAEQDVNRPCEHQKGSTGVPSVSSVTTGLELSTGLEPCSPRMRLLVMHCC